LSFWLDLKQGNNLIKMETQTLHENDRKNILFDVLDGIPASENEKADALIFRKEIEHDDSTLRFRAEELGLENILLEFSSECEL